VEAGRKGRPDNDPGRPSQRLGKYGLRTFQHLAKPLAPFYLRDLAPIKIQDEEAESRREIALLTIDINAVNKNRQCHKSLAGNLLEPLPELVLQAYACFVATKNDRALYDWRFHTPIPRSVVDRTHITKKLVFR
jgi:hypothetical protein